jgi:hypothetical protein
MKRILPAILTIVLLLTAEGPTFKNSALAQAVITVAQLNGTVRDGTGGLVPNTGISLRNLDTNRTYMSTSDASGYYIVPNLPPGTYELKVTSSGFEPRVQSGVQLTVGQTATLDVTLAVQGRRDFLRCHGSVLQVQFDAVDCDLPGTGCQGGAPMPCGFAGRSVSNAGRAANSVTHRRRYEDDRAFCSDARTGRQSTRGRKVCPSTGPITSAHLAIARPLFQETPCTRFRRAHASAAPWSS